MRRPRRPIPKASMERRTEIFEGTERWREIHSLYDAGNTVDGWFLEKLTWSREAFGHPDERGGIAVFVRITPDTY